MKILATFVLLSLAVGCSAPTTSSERSGSATSNQTDESTERRCGTQPVGEPVPGKGTIAARHVGKPAPDGGVTGKPEADEDDEANWEECLTEEQREAIRQKKERAAAAGQPPSSEEEPEPTDVPPGK